MHFLLVFLIFTLRGGIDAQRSASSLCACAPGALQINYGPPPTNYTFAKAITTTSSDGCDLTVHCTGSFPLTIGLFFSSTVKGDTPDRIQGIAILASHYKSDVASSSLTFETMRCVNGNWMPYIKAIDYQAINDPSDTSYWIMSNSIFCVRPKHSSAVAPNRTSSTTSTTPKSTTTKKTGKTCEKGFKLVDKFQKMGSLVEGSYEGHFAKEESCRVRCAENYGLGTCIGYVFEPDSKGKCTLFHNVISKYKSGLENSARLSIKC